MGIRARHCEGYDRLVASLNAEATHTGDVLETTLGTLVVPGDSMGKNGFIKSTGIFYSTGGAGNRTYRMYFGGNLFAEVTNANNNYRVDSPPKYVWNRGATNAQDGGILLMYAHSRAGEANVSFAVDTTADVDITYTVQLTNAAHTAFLRFALIEIFRFDS